MSSLITRRALLKGIAAASSVGVLAACQPKIVEVTTIVEKEKVVEKPVEKIVEKEVTKVVEKEKIVEQTVVVTKREPVTIQVWSAWQGTTATYQAVWESLLEGWTDANPDYPLKDTGVPGSQEEQMQKVAAAVAAGTPPDVWANTSPKTWGQRGMLVPLTAYAEAKGNWDPKNWFPNVITHYTDETDGTLYGLCHDSDSRGLYWRKDLFEEVGLDPEVPPKTWSEIRSMGLKLTKKSGDFYDRMGFVARHSEGYIEGYIGQAGGWPMLDWSGLPPKWRLNTPQAVAALTFMRDAQDDYGGQQNVSTFREGFQSGADDPFIAGQMAMMINGVWKLADFARYAPDMKFGITNEPIADEGGTKATLSGGWGWGVPIGALHPKEGFEFISYLCDYDPMKKWNEVTAHIPPRRDVAADPIFQQGNFKFFSDAMSWNGSWPSGPWTTSPGYNYGNAVDDACLGLKGVQEALDLAQQEHQAVADEYYQK